MEHGKRPQLSPNFFLSGPFRAAADAVTLEANQGKAAVDAGAFSEGEFVRAVDLQSRPDLNGSIGRLVRLYAEKDRWAVQFDKTGQADPVLIKPSNLQRGPRVCSVVNFASSEPQFATRRGLEWAGRTIRLYGIQGYFSSSGSDEIFYDFQSFRPGVVLMESFDVGEELDIASGDVLPYRDVFPSVGLEKALESVTHSDFRQAWAAEAVALLTALRIGAEIRLCDRLHSKSFDRIINRLSVLDLKQSLVQATEVMCQAIEKIRELRTPKSEEPLTLSDVPQNFLCQLFPELGVEREQLMGHFARLAAEQGHNVAIVVGVEHLAGIAEQFDMVVDANLSGTPTPAIVEYHKKLLSDAASDSKPGDDAWNEEIEKRTAVAAFLRSTLAFPADVVLPPADELQPEVAELVKKHFPRYKYAFDTRIAEALGGASQSAAVPKAKTRLPGLSNLHELCKN